MSKDEDFAKGIANRRTVLGDAWVDRALENTNPFNAEFQSLITRYAWHEVWGRPTLDHKTRRLMVLSTMIALGQFDEFEMHARAALQADVSLAELQEVLLQAAIYCGVPAANSAFAHMKNVFADLGIDPHAV
jgi:3-oxoadipate enol-lactonase